MMAIDTSPDRVQRAVLYFIAQEMESEATVKVSKSRGEHIVHVELPKAATKGMRNVEQDLQDFLPQGYTLDLVRT